ncbi:MAG TPA: PKD domain-containing protein, partial [Ferruginibacter sp.]|nr:PKD domain-containing protein [Ferruginibacter sp.]
TITFTDASAPNAGILTNWDWDFGDGNTSTIQSPTHTYASAGTYNAALKVTSSKGCVKTATKPVVINARPVADFIVPAVCLADTYAQFTDNSSVTPGTISFHEWNFGDPGSGPLNTSNAVNPTHSYTATGSYNVRLIVQSNTGCRDTIVKTIFVNGSFPVADFSVPAGTLCVNDSIPLTNLSTVFPGTITKLEIHWDDLGSPAFDTDNAPAVGKIYKHLYPNFQAPLTKTYTIRLVAYSGGICANEKSVVITVNAAPKVQFNALADTCFVASPFQLTQGSETGGLPGAESYTGPGVSSPAPGIYVFNPAAAGIGTHTIEYRFVSTAGCTDFKTRTIKVLDTAVANFSFSSPVCDKTAATFNELSVAPSGIVLSNTVWDFGDGSPLENHLPGSTFTHLFPAANTYTVKMYNVSANGCPSSVVTKQVTISPIPKPDFSVPTGVCLPKADMKFTNLTTIADGTGLLMTYSWDFGDGGTSTQVSPTHQYSTVGPFFVKL